jgi:phosphonate transport system substrate-binding protein
MLARTRRSTVALAGALALALAGAACGSDDDAGANESAGGETADGGREDWPDTLVFGAIPSEESTALEQSYAPIVEILERELDLEVEFFQATDYAGIIEAQIAGNVQLAQYGPFSYVIARDRGAEIEPIGAQVEEEGEEPGYQSYGIAPAGSDISSLADFEGRTVCFVDPSSTSGFLYPSAALLDEGIDPEADVEPVFAGGHDASVIAVDNGDCEAGFATDTMVNETAPNELGIAEGSLEVVWESDTIAGSPLAVSTTLPASLVDEIRRVILEEANSDALLEAGLCEGDCPLTDENVWGYAEVDDAFYDGVRDVCETTQAQACTEG